MEENYNKAIEILKQSNSIYIVSHTVPDGDAIGSSFAMYHVLKNMGKRVNVLMPKYADRFNFLEDIKKAKQNIEESEYDLLLCLDASDLDRLAISKQDYIKAKKVVVIDHHVKKSIDADAKVLNQESPATCEIIYEMLTNQNVIIDENIAKYLYLGILTDTGSFNYQRTTSRTYRIAANLLDTGIDFADICKKVNDTIKENKLKLIALAVDKIESYLDNKVKYTQIEWNEMEELSILEEEADGVTNYLRMIEGVKVAVYVRGLPDGTYKVSMRSNGDIDISKIAMHFNGGGHVRAAGFSIPQNVDEVKKELIKLIGDELED